MSDDESFVILGSSPMPSIETDGVNTSNLDKLDSMQKDTPTPPGSCFTSLKSSQISTLENAAREVVNKTLKENEEQLVKSASSNSSGGTAMEKSAESLLWSRPQQTENSPEAPALKESAESLLWSRPPQVEQNKSLQTSLNTNSQVEVKDDFEPLSFEDCALQSPLQQSPQTSLTSKAIIHTEPLSPNTSFIQNANANKENLEPSQQANDNNMTKSQQNSLGSGGCSKHNSLASSFILGDVSADVLKSSVYSQFPSISMQACAEDVVKLQNMVTDYMQLKTTLEKVNATMRLFYENSLEWKDRMRNMETHYKQELQKCQKQILDLRSENLQLKKSIDDQVEQTKAVDLARQSDRDEMIKTISEKTSLVENMRAQIVKLEEQQIATFEILPKKPKDKKDNGFENLYITRGEHELIVKDLKRQLSVFLASNLDLKDIEKQYLDELNCLKHNLQMANETITRTRNELSELQTLNNEQQQKIAELQKSNQDLVAAGDQQNRSILQLEKEYQSLLSADAAQNERILLLEHQNEVHKKDFEMERDSRQNAVGEKQQILQDLRNLQKRNQELIEEHQKYVENYEKQISRSSSVARGYDSNISPLVAAAAAAQSFINNSQRPIRDLPVSQPLAQNASDQYNCPVCNKGFKSISVLTSHVNDCIDRN